MAKRARYDGAYEEVAVFDPEQDVYAAPVAIVKRGHWLPDDVPARIRNSLLRGDDWTEVEQSDKATGKGDS